MVTLLQVPETHRISAILPELKTRGMVYVAEDRRGTYQFVGQTISAIMYAIQHLCNERPAKTSMFDCANGDMVRGRTGSFAVHKFDLSSVLPYLDKTRDQYAQLIICTRNDKLWRLTT